MLEILRIIAIFAIPFLLILTVVVAVHEGGHFLVARLFGVAVDRFSIGFGKPIFAHTARSGVEYRIGWIPLGGYVRFAGDTNDSSVPDQDDLESMRAQIEAKLGKEAVSRFYHFKPVWQRALIAAAGPIANFLLAIAIFAVVVLTFDQMRWKPIVGGVVPGSPAEAAGLMTGDVIKSIDGRPISDFSQISDYVQLRGGEQITVVLEREGRRMTVQPVLRQVNEKNKDIGARVKYGQLGILTHDDAYYLYRASNPIEAVAEAGRMVWMRLEATFTYLGRIFTGRENGDQITGIIGMAGVTGNVTKNTIESSPDAQVLTERLLGFMINLTATISIGLGFVNLLPIPMLDGGHLLFYAYEAVARRPLSARVQAASFKVGLALVLALMLFATWNDLVRFDAFRFLGGLIS